MKRALQQGFLNNGIDVGLIKMTEHSLNLGLGQGVKDAFLNQLLLQSLHADSTLPRLQLMWLETLLGPMIAVADDAALYLLEFMTRKGLERELMRLQRAGFVVVQGETAILKSIRLEVEAYFAGSLKVFQTPYRVFGSPFQQQVWEALCQIPYGQTISYAQQAAFLENPSAYRAVANANGANQLAIVIPCHRVIASDGGLGGYGGGLKIKQWLLEHEKRFSLKEC